VSCVHLSRKGVSRHRSMMTHCLTGTIDRPGASLPVKSALTPKSLVLIQIVYIVS
jgi:hypothetical protein